MQNKVCNHINDCLICELNRNRKALQIYMMASIVLTFIIWTAYLISCENTLGFLSILGFIVSMNYDNKIHTNYLKRLEVKNEKHK